MGTTLAFCGAYNLAGSLIHHPNDHAAAFDAYERRMRPVVDRAQKLAPGMPYLINPETAWGVWMLHAIVFVLGWSGLMNLLVRFKGPPANTVPVEEYGFKQLPEWMESADGEFSPRKSDSATAFGSDTISGEKDSWQGNLIGATR